MHKSLKILVAGGYDVNDPKALAKSTEKIIAFTKALGKEIIAQGHILLTGCQTELDKNIAEAAAEYLAAHTDNQPNHNHRIISYVLKDHPPVHNRGTIMQSDLPDWDLGGLEPRPPEVIREADAVILLGGFFGTYKAANWARLERKPLLPFVCFGGAAKEVFGIESQHFADTYAAHIDRIEYDEVLKAVTEDWPTLAKSTVNLAEKIVTTPSVFVVMSFTESGQYKDLYSSIQRACKEYEYEAMRVDEANLLKRINPEIVRMIRQSAFIIVDVTEQKANVFYELGFADGVGKEVILTAKKGSVLPFDIKDVPVVFWESFVDFEESLKEVIRKIGAYQGRE